jgi:hypothetical protein
MRRSSRPAFLLWYEFKNVRYGIVLYPHNESSTENAQSLRASNICKDSTPPTYHATMSSFREQLRVLLYKNFLLKAWLSPLRNLITTTFITCFSPFFCHCSTLHLFFSLYSILALFFISFFLLFSILECLFYLVILHLTL